MQRISQHIGESLADELTMSQDQAEIMAYGMEIILSSVTKIILILAVAYVLGIFNTTLTVLLCFCSYRLFSGGVHFSDYYRCLAFGLITMLLLGALSQKLGVNVELYLREVTFISGLIMFVAALQWAPAENPNRLLTDREKRNFKYCSEGFIMVWIIAVQIILVWDLDHNDSIVLASTLALLLQSLTLTPTSYRVVGVINRLLDFLRKGGVQHA